MDIQYKIINKWEFNTLFFKNWKFSFSLHKNVKKNNSLIFVTK